MTVYISWVTKISNVRKEVADVDTGVAIRPHNAVKEAKLAQNQGKEAKLAQNQGKEGRHTGIWYLCLALPLSRHTGRQGEQNTLKYVVHVNNRVTGGPQHGVS
jgi:hypothetical protein